MYFCWIAFIRKGGVDGSEKSVLVREGPWFRLLFAGIGLMIIGLLVAAFTGGMNPEGRYQPPYAKDGEIVPGRGTAMSFRPARGSATGSGP